MAPRCVCPECKIPIKTYVDGCGTKGQSSTIREDRTRFVVRLERHRVKHSDQFRCDGSDEVVG